MPSKKRVSSKKSAPKYLRNTSAKILVVDPDYLEPGKLYILQHSKEGLSSVGGPIHKELGTDPSIFITRFKARFVRHDVGRSGRFPDGIPGIIAPSKNVAVFEDVKIISKNKRFPLYTPDIYLIKPDKVVGYKAFDFCRFGNDFKTMTMFIEQSQHNPDIKVAFSTGSWTFGETNQNPVAENYVNVLEPTYRTETEHQLFSDYTYGNRGGCLGDAVFNPTSTALLIAKYLYTNTDMRTREVSLNLGRSFTTNTTPYADADANADNDNEN